MKTILVYNVPWAVPYGAAKAMMLYAMFYERMKRMGSYRIRVDPIRWVSCSP